MSATPSDADLVGEALSGVTGAFDELVGRYWRAAVSMARQRTRSWVDAEDAAQEAFVLAFRKLRSLRSPERFGGWLFIIVQRACIEAARRRARRPLAVADLEGIPVSEADLDPIRASAGEVREQIRLAIDALPEHYRPVVILRYGQGMAVKDIGQSLGIPVGTVVSQIFRANRILRTKLQHLVVQR